MKLLTWAEFKRYVEDLGVNDDTRIKSIDVTEPDVTEQTSGKELHVDWNTFGEALIISL